MGLGESRSSDFNFNFIRSSILKIEAGDKQTDTEEIL